MKELQVDNVLQAEILVRLMQHKSAGSDLATCIFPHGAIQISRTKGSPTYEELQQRTSGEVINIQGIPVVILENAAPDRYMEERGIKPILAYFWNDGLYYIITTHEGETTREDMMKIVENMKPVGPETLQTEYQ